MIMHNSFFEGGLKFTTVTVFGMSFILGFCTAFGLSRVVCDAHLRLLAPWTAWLFSQWILHGGESMQAPPHVNCSHANTHQRRARGWGSRNVPFFKSSVWRDKNGTRSYFLSSVVGMRVAFINVIPLLQIMLNFVASMVAGVWMSRILKFEKISEPVQKFWNMTEVSKCDSGHLCRLHIWDQMFRLSQ